MIKGDAAETVSERWDLLPPTHVVAATAMSENNGWPLTGLIREEVYAIDLKMRHGTLTRWRNVNFAERDVPTNKYSLQQMHDPEHQLAEKRNEH